MQTLMLQNFVEINQQQHFLKPQNATRYDTMKNQAIRLVQGICII